MSMKRAHPAKHEVRKGKAVGPDYDQNRYRNPVGAEMDHTFNASSDKTIAEYGDKTIASPNGTTFSPPLTVNHGYESLWKGK